jgi:hypothetical protein
MIMGRIMSHTTRKVASRKAKKSYSLSPESVEFLNTIRKRRHASSVSAVLEEILQSVRREQSKSDLEQQVEDYYSSLSLDEAAEQTRWGEFALREFPRDKI